MHSERKNSRDYPIVVGIFFAPENFVSFTYIEQLQDLSEFFND